MSSSTGTPETSRAAPKKSLTNRGSFVDPCLLSRQASRKVAAKTNPVWPRLTTVTTRNPHHPHKKPDPKPESILGDRCVLGVPRPHAHVRPNRPRFGPSYQEPPRRPTSRPAPTRAEPRKNPDPKRIILVGMPCCFMFRGLTANCRPKPTPVGPPTKKYDPQKINVWCPVTYALA